MLPMNSNVIAAHEFKRYGIPMPAPLEDDAPLMVRIHDAMFRGNSDEAFGLLRQGLTERVLAEPQQPQMSVMQDQIVWGRSPVRIDIAGGWRTQWSTASSDICETMC